MKTKLFMFIFLVAVLLIEGNKNLNQQNNGTKSGINGSTSVNKTNDKILTTNLTKTSILPKMNTSIFPLNISSETNSTEKAKINEKGNNTEVDTSNTNNSTVQDNNKKNENYSVCSITRRLYDSSIPIKETNKIKNCTEPGCFFVYEQPNLGWDFPAFMVENKKKNKKLYLTGCRYDIPYLLERNQGNERVARAMSALRACYIGIKKEANDSNHCQPEYEGKGLKLLNQGMDDSLRSDGQRDTWAGRFLPSTQNRCFVDFLHGVFYVDDNGKGLIVCCSSGTDKDHVNFKSKCISVTNEINKLEWREDKDN